MRSGYSSNVVLSLMVNGVQVALSHVAPSFVVARSLDAPLPPGTQAELVVQVDQQEQRELVVLPEGMTSAKFQTVYRKIF